MQYEYYYDIINIMDVGIFTHTHGSTYLINVYKGCAYNIHDSNSGRVSEVEL